MSEEKAGGGKLLDEAIALTAASAAFSVEGVAFLGAGLTENISINLRFSTHPRGIKIIRTENEIVIDIFVNVFYGYKIPEVAWNIQERVKTEVEKITDDKIKGINIHIQGVSLAEENTEDEGERLK